MPRCRINGISYTLIKKKYSWTDLNSYKLLNQTTEIILKNLKVIKSLSKIVRILELEKSPEHVTKSVLIKACDEYEIRHVNSILRIDIENKVFIDWFN